MGPICNDVKRQTAAIYLYFVNVVSSLIGLGTKQNPRGLDWKINCSEKYPIKKLAF